MHILILKNLQEFLFVIHTVFGKFMIFKLSFISKRGTSIADHSTFVLFDEARTRGADIKMDIDVIIATLALSSNTSKDKIIQAIGRLRRLGKDQSIIVLKTYEIYLIYQTSVKTNI
jgi:hypothetical protein